MNDRSIFISASLLLAAACSSDGEKQQCAANCFTYTVTPASPESCFDENLNPFPIPFWNAAGNGYDGESCPGDPTQVAETNQAIEDLNASGSTLCSDAYNTTADEVKADAFQRCLEVAPEGEPSAEPEIPGCTASSIAFACGAIADDIDNELASISGVLTHFVQMKTIPASESCDFEPAATGGPEQDCAPGGTSGATSTGGLDSTGTTGMGASPFGDIASQIGCAGQLCYVTDELFEAVIANFAVFYDDGLYARLLPPSHRNYPGVMLTGIDSSDESFELFDELGIEDGDVFREANGIVLVDEDDAIDAIESLTSSTGAAFEIIRGGTTINYLVYIRV